MATDEKDDELLESNHAHGADEEVDEEDDEDEDDVVILSDADGNETEFQFLALVEVEGDQYALLTPADESDENATEIFIFKYEQDEDGGEIFSDVADEETFAKVRAEAEQLFSTLEDEPEDEDEEEEAT
jgi:uncharacterized protein YrzB (UPF0473 family)